MKLISWCAVSSISAVLVSASWLIGIQNAKADNFIKPSQDKNITDRLVAFNQQADPLEQQQVTSVSQLSDVKPTDWAFQALQSLVERYGCIAGYPDKTYRGNRAMTRYEFAAGLNACMDRVNDLIAASTADSAKKTDLETLRKLQEQFAAELATLRGRVDALESKTATLEKQQFSTTTKLSGEAIFAISDEFSSRSNNTVFQNRVRLSLNTSFTGKDLLTARLDSGNSVVFEGDQLPGVFNGLQPAGILDLGEGLQTHNFGASSANSVRIGHLAYSSSVFNDRLKYYIPVVGGLHYSYAPTLNPVLDSGNSGSTTLSMFGQRNPIYDIGGGAGLGLNFNLGPAKISLGYLANAANNPSSGNGLFNGNYSGLLQVAYEGDRFGLGATYVSAYKTNGEGIFEGGSRALADNSTGTTYANIISFFDPLTGLTLGNRAKVDAYGLSGYLKITPSVVLNAFATYATVDYSAPSVETGQVWTYGLGISFPDLGKKGNLGGLVVGVQPYLGNPVAVSKGTYGAQAVPIHVEAFYKYQLTDRISITPGVIWISNPGQITTTNDAFIGTLRTTFTF